MGQSVNKRSLFLNNIGFYLIILISGIFSYLFSYYSIIKYLSLNAYGYDLGVQVQIYSSTIHHEFLYSTLINESLLAQHFSPFVFIIFVLYYFFPSPKTLLIIQALAISFAAVPLFLISKNLLLKQNISNFLANVISLIIAVSYLISPYVESPVTFDFHIMIFLNLFIFLSFYFFLKKNWVLDAIFICLIVSLHSEYAIIAILIIITQYLLLNKFPWHLYELKSYKNKLLQRKTLIGFVSIIILVLYFLLIPLLKENISHNTASGHIASIVTVGLPAGGVTGLLSDIFLRPDVLLNFLSYQSKMKLSYFLTAFSNTGFLAFLSPLTLLPAIPYIGFASLSKYTSYYQVGWQYTVMLIPMIYLSTAFSVASLYRYVKKIKKRNIQSKIKVIVTLIIMFILLSSLIFEFSSSPIAPIKIYHKEGVMDDLNSFHTNNATILIFAFQSKIRNSDPYLLTINNLFPVFAFDYNAYLTLDNTTQLQNLIKNFGFEYIVTQPNNVEADIGEPTVTQLTENQTYMSHYGIYMESSGPSEILIYKLNYTSAPVCVIN